MSETPVDPTTPEPEPARPAPLPDVALPLLRVCRLLEHPVPPGVARDLNTTPTRPWEEALTTHAGALSLAVARCDLDPREVVALADARRPLVTFVGGGQGGGAWVVVGPPTRGGVLAWWMGDAGVAEREVDAPGLVAWVGLSPDERRVWLGLEASLGLEALRSPPGGPTLTPLRRLAALVRDERNLVASVAVYAAVSGLLTLAIPVAVQGVITTVTQGAVLQPLVVLTAVLAAALAGSGFSWLMEVWAVELLQRRLFVRLAVDLAHRLPRALGSAGPAAWLPALLNRFFDVTTAQKTLGKLLLSGLDVVLQVGVGMMLLAFYHPLLLAFDALLVGGLLLLLALGRGGIKTAIKESSAKHAVAAWLQQVAHAPLSFRAPEGEALAVRRVDGLAQGWLAARQKHFKVVWRQLVGGVIVQVFASAALLGLGGWLVLQGQLSVGQLVAAELVVTLVVRSMARFGHYFEGAYDLLAALDKVGVLLDLPLEPDGALGPRPQGPAALSWQLPSGQVNVRPGERVAIRPRSGQPSRLLGALFGLEGGTDPVELDGIPLTRWSARGLRDRGRLLRGAELITASVAENVTLGRAGLDSGSVWAALDRLGLAEVVAALPDGLDTPLSPDDPRLSGGEALRLTLARQWVAQPGLLLIDGALDALAAAELDRVMGALTAPSAPWTLVVSTTRREVARRLDRWVDEPGGES